MPTERLSLSLLLFLLFFAACFFVPDILFLNRDLGWHIELGNSIRKTGIVPDLEAWSSTAKGHSFLHWYWLWDIPASYLYELTGDFRALFVFTAAQCGLIVAIIGLHLLARGCSTLITFLVATFFGMSWLICSPEMPSLTISPRTASFVLFALMHFLLFRIVERDRVQEAWLLSPLIAVWGNTHRLAVLGLPALVFYGLEALIAGKYRTVLALAGATVLGFALVMLLHPMHLEVYRLYTSAADDPSISTGSLAYDFARSSSALYLLTFFGLALFTQPRLKLSDSLHVFVWLAAGLRVTDAFPLFLVASAPVMGELFSRIRPLQFLERVDTAFAILLRWLPSAILLSTLTLSALALSPGYLAKQYPGGMDYPPRLYPSKALEFLRANYADRRILTDWNYGGFIIHKTHGLLPVWVDGRSGNAYPLELLADANRLNVDPAAILEKYGSEVTFLGKYRPANLYLSASPQWRLTYEDNIVRIYERIGKDKTGKPVLDR